MSDSKRAETSDPSDTTIDTNLHPPVLPHPHSHLSPTPLYRITTLFRPHQNLTAHAFSTHWYHTHGPLCVPWALHYNIVEYTQYLTPPDLQTTLARGKDSQGGARGVSTFGACADFYVRDYEDYLRAFRDEYYLEVVAKDEDKFIDKGQVEDSAKEEGQGGDQEGAERERRGGGAGTRGLGGSVRAVSMMGYCRSIIKDGKAVVEVKREIWDLWEEYQRRKARTSYVEKADGI